MRLFRIVFVMAVLVLAGCVPEEILWPGCYPEGEVGGNGGTGGQAASGGQGGGGGVGGSGGAGGVAPRPPCQYPAEVPGED